MLEDATSSRPVRGADLTMIPRPVTGNGFLGARHANALEQAVNADTARRDLLTRIRATSLPAKPSWLPGFVGLAPPAPTCTRYCGRPSRLPDAMAPFPYDWRLTVSMLEGSSTVHVWDLAPARRREEVALPTRAQCMTAVGQGLVIGLGDDVGVLERNR
ncbi:hypothetical protein [Streptomyces sp. NPDC085540]|uniref:hypothetical protein n=1 Tax=Streptomyces sp. NPDC085540 TaxID=3365730 RepID=UPI0037CD5472